MNSSFPFKVSADVSLSSSLRVKALSCIALLIRLKSKVPLQARLLHTETNVISVRDYENVV